MNTRYFTKPLLSISVAALLTAGAVTGCSTTSTPYASTSAYPASSAVAANYGRIETIEYVRGGSGGTSGAGAVVGGLVGGLLGNQVGGGTGRAAATVAGAVGGAVVGNKIEENRQGGADAYQIGVRLDNGAFITVTQDNVNDLRIGNRVTIQNNRVYRY
ncbi:MAG TPA: glycine zipper 2TM domain-containing protein [Burkholderiaceae bacterium]